MSTHPLKEPEEEPEEEPERGDNAQHGFDGGDGGGYDGPMHRRVTRLEEFAIEARRRFDRIDATLAELGGRLDRGESRMDRSESRLDRIETRLDRIETRLDRMETRLEFTATKEDVERSANSIIKWMVGVLVALSMAAITIITFVLNYATPPTPAAATQPIVIYLPAAPGPAPASGSGSAR